MRELSKDQWAKAATITNMLRAHSAEYQNRVKEDYLKAAAGHLVDYPIDSIEAALEDLTAAHGAKFPEIHHLKGACSRRTISPSDEAVPGFTKSQWAEYQKEQKEYIKLKKKMLAELGEESLNKYFKYYLKQMFPEGYDKDLMGVVGESALSKPALFDLRDAGGHPAKAIEIAREKARILGQNRKRAQSQ